MPDDDIAAGRHVITTQVGKYEMTDWVGYNASGMKALCDKVIVLPDQAQAMIGGIHLPDASRENIGTGATTGILVSVGPQAFAWDSHGMHRWEGEKPQPGDRVFFQKYAGMEHVGADGQTYRIMEYRSIGATMEPMPELVTATEGVESGEY